MTANELQELFKIYLDDDNFKCFKGDLDNVFYVLNNARDVLINWITQFEGDYFATSCEIPLIAGTQIYSLPDGTLYNDAPACNGYIDFATINDERLEPGKFIDFFDGDDGTPEFFALRHKSIYLYPTPIAADTMELHYFYLPAALSASDLSATVDFIPGYESLIALYASLMTKVRLGDDITGIATLIGTIKNELKVHIGSRVRSVGRMMAHEGEM